MERKAFGILPDGRTVEELTIRGGGLTASVLTWGGILRTLWVPTKDGSTVDVLLGMDTVGDYFITKVHHRFGPDGYLTQFEVKGAKN